MGRNWLSLFSATEGRAVQIPLTVGSFELSLLSEVSFKLGMLRIVIIDKNLIADQVEARW